MTAGAIGRLRMPAYLAMTILMALIALRVGWAVSGQHYKVLGGLLLVPALAALGLLGRSVRFKLLLLAAALTPLQTPSLLPYGLSMSELLLLGLIAVQWTPAVSRRLSRGLGVLVPLMFFLTLGLLAGYLHGELGASQVVCVTPLLWFLAAAVFVRSPRDALRVQVACILSAALYVAIVRLASALGYGGTVFAVAAGSASRLGAAGWALDVGPVSVRFWSTWLAALVGVAMPGAALFFVRAKGHALARYSWLAIMALFVYAIVLSAGRGGALGGAIGIAVALLTCGRLSPRRVLLASAGLGVFGMVFQSILTKAALSVLPGSNLSRIGTLLRFSTDQTGNFQYRVRVLQETVAGVAEAPFGRGFNYWYSRGVDDPIAYAMLLNGVGVLGVLAFGALIAVLAATYMRRVAHATGAARDAIAVALGTLVAAMVAGGSSHTVWIAPVHTFLFWGILMSTYWGVVTQARRSD
jgi:hypothetical protein